MEDEEQELKDIARPEDVVEKLTQSERIIKKFGGAYQLAEALRLSDPNTKIRAAAVYRWTYPTSKGGTGGLIPNRMWRPIILAARLNGVLLLAEDFIDGLIDLR